MILKVSPTRVALLNLKKELKLAQKGHKLLKDKRDGLVKKFMEVIYDARDLRQKVEDKIGSAFGSYARAGGLTSDKVLQSAFIVPNAQIELDVHINNVMSVKVPEFKINKTGSAVSYSVFETTGDLDYAMTKFDEAFVDIVKLAGLEKTAENLAEEIEKTRRRVSALENIRIPDLEDTIKFITMQLDERNRDAVVSTMRVKAMITEKENV